MIFVEIEFWWKNFEIVQIVFHEFSWQIIMIIWIQLFCSSFVVFLFLGSFVGWLVSFASSLVDLFLWILLCLLFLRSWNGNDFVFVLLFVWRKGIRVTWIGQVETKFFLGYIWMTCLFVRTMFGCLFLEVILFIYLKNQTLKFLTCKERVWDVASHTNK